MKVSPSILSCDFSKIADELDSISNSDFIHIDVMDGMFVPNITFGAPVIKKFKKCTNVLFDTHLMIDEPIRYIKDFVEAGSDYITIHVEACDNVLETLECIKKYGAKTGISVKPSTCIEELNPYLKLVDMVLIMSVEPGFGGQKFMKSSLDKIKYLKEQKNNGYDYLINVDGGINNETALLVKEAGADVIVSGSYLFGQSDRNSFIEELKKI